MASTRYNSDRARLEKRNMIDTVVGRYMLDTPGNGVELPYIADPHMRIQKSGTNFCENMIDINSDLRCMTRPLTRDIPELNDYKKYAAKPNKSYTSEPDEVNYVSDETRASNPAWVLKESELNRWVMPLINPVDMNYVSKPFYENLNTRILERDYFKPKFNRSNDLYSNPVPYNS